MTDYERAASELRHAGTKPPGRGYVDIHAHLLPGIDDGPDDLDEAIRMARAAVEVGIETVAATPHLRSDFPGVHLEEIASRCEALRQKLAQERIPLRLEPAAEASLTWALGASDEQLALASYAQRGKDLLIETPFGPIAGLDRLLYLLRSKGYRVTLAHPERSFQFQRDPEALRNLVSQGVLLQVNATSLLGSGGRARRRLVQTLFQDGLVHVIASDGHRGNEWRPVTVLAEGIAAAADLVGVERARWLASAAPAAIVAGEELPVLPAVQRPARRRLFGRR